MFTLFISVSLFVISVFFSTIPFSDLIIFIGSFVTVLYFGFGIILKGIRSITSVKPDEYTLLLIAVALIFIYSGLSALSPDTLQILKLKNYVFFEVAAVVIGFVLLVEYVEENAIQFIETKINEKIIDGKLNKSEIQKILDTYTLYLEEIKQKNVKRTNLFSFIVLFGATIFSLYMYFHRGDSEAVIIFISIVLVASPAIIRLFSIVVYQFAWYKALCIGVLIIKPDSIGRILQADKLLFSKTGLLTKGKLSVTSTLIFSEKKDFINDMIYNMELAIYNPISQALIEYTSHDHVSNLEFTNIDYIEGKGIVAIYEGCSYYLGNSSLLKEKNIKFDNNLIPPAYRLSTLIYFANDKEVLALFALRDFMHDFAYESVQTILDFEIDTHLISGDRVNVVTDVAERAGIHNFDAEEQPEDKEILINGLLSQSNLLIEVDLIGENSQDKNKLIQVGVFDEHELTIDKDLLLVEGNIKELADFCNLSSKVKNKITQNMVWAISYNTIMIPIAAGVIYPLTGELLSPMFAGIAMSFSALFTIANGLRVR